MLNAKISGIASYLPDYVLTNDELSRMVDTNDEWITTRVGIKERRILKKEVGSSYMGIQAVKKLLEETGTNPDDVDLLICATSNPDYPFPFYRLCDCSRLRFGKEMLRLRHSGCLCRFYRGFVRRQRLHQERLV